MKKIILLSIVLLSFGFVKAQTRFSDMSDVIKFMDNKTYYNSETETELGFGYISSYNTYGIELKSNKSGRTMYFINCDINGYGSFADVSGTSTSDGSYFKFRLYNTKIVVGVGEQRQTTFYPNNSSFNSQNFNSVKSTSPNPSTSKKSNYNFLPKYVVGTYYSKELGTTLVIEKILYKRKSDYYRFTEDLHGESIKNSAYKWDLRLKVKTKTGKTFNMNLEGYNRETLDFNLEDLNYNVVFGKNESGYTLSSVLNIVPVRISSTKLDPKDYIFKRIK